MVLSKMSPQAMLVSQGLSSSNTSVYFQGVLTCFFFCFHPFIQRWRINCYMHHIYNYLFCFCSHSMRKQPKERPAPNNLMVSFFTSLLHSSPHKKKKSKSTFKRFRTWNMKCQLFDWQSKWMGVFDCRKAFVGTPCKGLCKTLTFFSSGFCLKTSSILF